MDLSLGYLAITLENLNVDSNDIEQIVNHLSYTIKDDCTVKDDISRELQNVFGYTEKQTDDVLYEFDYTIKTYTQKQAREILERYGITN